MSSYNFNAAVAATSSADYFSMCGCSGCFKFTANYSSPQQSAIARSETASIVDKDDDGQGGGGVQTLLVDGAEVYDTINTPNDIDFFKVDLVAGRTYEIGQFLVTDGATRGGSGVPLADAFFEVLDATGKVLASADGGGPDTPSGLDALLRFTAESSGTYFIRARSFDNDGTNGPDGDFVGDYKMFVKTSTAAEPAFKTPYDVDSPLHSLDWGGAVFTGSSRNPDGQEGPRPTGNPAGTGAVIGGGEDGGPRDNVGDVQPVAGKTVLTYYFVKPTDNPVLLNNLTQPGLEDIPQVRFTSDYEKDAYRAAFKEYEKVADLIYVEVADISQAYFKIVTYQGTPGAGASLLGRASPPGETQEGQMEFNAGDYRYNENGLTKGGFFFPTLLHEMGHAHGMAHPHDNGGGSSVMRGAGGGTGGIGGAYGDFNLSQGIFTMMSYNDGWDLRPDGTRASPSIPAQQRNEVQPHPDYGFVGSFGALDIAVIQDKYGVNEEWATGDDVYQLKDKNEKGTFYETIWDAGGVDSIVYDGARNGVIDLRPATLRYENGGGGFVSYYQGIMGGFTVANGVTIENARGGSGSDFIVGNAAANQLSGGAGNDVLIGDAGADRIDGGTGADTAVFYRPSKAYSLAVNAGSGTVGGSVDGGDQLSGVETLRFVDGRLVMNSADVTAQVHRLYITVLGREGDYDGFQSYVAQLEGGVSLAAVADQFAGSVEFAARYGSLNNRQFVEALYKTGLGRDGDAASVTAWTAELDAGRLSRAQVTTGLSESQEQINRTQARVDQGLWVEDQDASAIARIYYTAFGRAPDSDGLAGWRAAVSGGETLGGVADKFALSGEFGALYGGLSNAQFVDKLYQVALGREADAAGRAGWIAELDSGRADRGDMVLNFAQSQEMRDKTAPVTDGGVVLLGGSASSAPAAAAEAAPVADAAELAGDGDTFSFARTGGAEPIVVDAADPVGADAAPESAFAPDSWTADGFAGPFLDMTLQTETGLLV